MPNLSIKNVPEPVVEKLRQLAAANHRSLQGELMAMVCQAAEGLERGSAPEHRKRESDEGASGHVESGWKSIEQIWEEHRSRRAEPVSEGPRAVDVIREERDAR